MPVSQSGISLVGKFPSTLSTCKISCAMSITSVISYTTLICSEWSVRISCTTFCWWYPFIFLVLGGTSAIQLCGRFVSVSGPLQVPGIETKEDSCRWPSTHEVANRHIHSCLLALAWVTVLPPTESCGHAPPWGNDTQVEVDVYVTSRKNVTAMVNGYQRQNIFNTNWFLTPCPLFYEFVIFLELFLFIPFLSIVMMTKMMIS